MFRIQYGVNTQTKFNRSTRIALEQCCDEYLRYGNITVENVFECINEMLDTDHEEYNKNSCYMEYGFGSTITVEIVVLKQDYVEINLYW